MIDQEQPKKKRWMIFRTEVTYIYYIWVTDNPVPALISLPPGTNPEPYYWMGNPPMTLPSHERNVLDDMARSKKIVMTFPKRTKQRFKIVARGDVDEEE